MSLIGRVKWYDKQKGYGFIESPEGDVFFHFTDIQMDGFKSLTEEQRVNYTLVRGPQGLKAKDISPLDQRTAPRQSARYRAVVQVNIKPDKIEEYEEFILDIPAWYEAMEQQLGMRRLGTWRNDSIGVTLLECDLPYDECMEKAKDLAVWPRYEKWLSQLAELIEGEPSSLDPIQHPFEVEEEPVVEDTDDDDEYEIIEVGEDEVLDDDDEYEYVEVE
jgi:cold shock protein